MLKTHPFRFFWYYQLEKSAIPAKAEVLVTLDCLDDKRGVDTDIPPNMKLDPNT